MRIRRTRMATAVVAATALMALTGAPSASASGSLDAQCTPSGPAGFASFNGNYVTAQTFVAGHSGNLATADVIGVHRQPGGTGADITVQVRSVSGGVPTGNVLATATIPGASVPGDAMNHDYTVNFGPSGAAHLDEGQSYALALTTADTTQTAWAMWGGNQCAGTFYGNYAGPFQPISDGSYDAAFKAYLAPPNDYFGKSELVSGTDPTVPGSTFGGTRQAGEPDHYTNVGGDIDWIGDHSVWFKWTALGSGPTVIDTCTADIDSILAVYTGSSLGTLSRVNDVNNGCPTGWGSILSINAAAGTTYRIAVGDAGGLREDGFSLHIDGQPNEPPTITNPQPPPNSTTPDDTPLIQATVSDSATELERADMKLFLDGVRKRAFTYDATLDQLSFQTNPLGAGQHKARIVATDEQGAVGSRLWKFQVP